MSQPPDDPAAQARTPQGPPVPTDAVAADPYAPDPYAPDPYAVPSTGHASPPPAGYPGTGDPFAPPAYPWAAGAPAYGSYPTPPERQPGTDGFSIAAFVLGILSIVPLAVIFGIVALRRIRRSHRGGKGLAVAALAISGIWVAVAATGIAVALANHVDRNSTGVITGAGKVAASDLHVGDCIQYPNSDATTVQTFDAVPCTQPHDAEAYDGGQLPLSGDWPGEDVVDRATEQRCSDAFKSFVGVDIDSSVLQVSYFYPEQDAWKQGDRGYVCVVGSDADKTTGTLKGAAR